MLPDNGHQITAVAMTFLKKYEGTKENSPRTYQKSKKKCN